MCILFKQHFNIGSGHGCWSTSRKKSEGVGRVGAGWIPSCSEARVPRAKSEAVGRAGAAWIPSCSEAKVHRGLKAWPSVELGPD